MDNKIIIICLCTNIISLLIYSIILMIILYKYNKDTFSRFKQHNMDSLEEFKNHIKNMNSGIVDDIVDLFKDDDSKNMSKSDEAKAHHEKLLNTFSKLRNIIKDDLYEVMNNTGACRTALYLFHNGTRSTMGLSFLKVSCIGEKTLVGSGVKEQIINHSNMPINLFDNMFENLMDHGRYLVMNDEETMQSARRQFISASKIRYAVAVSIYDSNNNILGFILAEYNHAYTKTLADSEYDKLKIFANKVAPILSFSEYADLTIESNNTES